MRRWALSLVSLRVEEAAARGSINLTPNSPGSTKRPSKCLGLEECDVAALHVIFRKVQDIKRLRQLKTGSDSKGLKSIVGQDDPVRVGDMCVYFEEERSTLTNVLFAYFSRGAGERKIADEEDGTGAKISFGSFVLSLWNILSLPGLQLPAFIFNVYDVDESGSLDIHEITRMLTQRTFSATSSRPTFCAP